MTLQSENRPQDTDGFQKSSGGSTSIVPQFSPDMAAARAHGVLMVLVHNPQTDRVRRRLFFSLDAADRCAARARDRAQTAHIVLGRFHAIEVVPGE